MRYLKNLTYLVLLSNFLLILGCSKNPSSPLETTSIEKKLLDNFNKTAKLDYKVYPATRIVGKTFWVYIGTEENIIQISSVASMGGLMPEEIVKFLDINCQYENSAFNISYIFLKYSEEEISKKQDIFNKTVGGTTLYQDFTRATLEILQKAYLAIGDIIAETEDFNFFAICLANIKEGIKITFVIHRLDMEQFLNNMLPSDEFYNRMILKTEGNKETINDKYGISIDYNDISLIDFLEEQMVNNVRHKINEMEKYNPQQLKAIDKLDDMILKNTYGVITKYEFDDYLLVEVENTLDREKITFSKSKLLKRFSPQKEDYYSEEPNF